MHFYLFTAATIDVHPIKKKKLQGYHYRNLDVNIGWKIPHQDSKQLSW